MMGTEETDLLGTATDLVLKTQGLPPVAKTVIGRLIGAVVDPLIALLERPAERIRIKTKLGSELQLGLGRKAIDHIIADPDNVDRTILNMVGKARRKQDNLDAVGVAALQDMAKNPPPHNAVEPDVDWFNIFERYAEDAGSDGMRDLWGRVLAGELRKKGSFSFRALRCISEMSQEDAELFQILAKSAFGGSIPVGLTRVDYDISPFISLEANGLISGVAASIEGQLSPIVDGTWHPIVGQYVFRGDGNIILAYKLKDDADIFFKTLLLTPVGTELLSLVQDRDVVECAKVFAKAIKCPEIHECHLGIKDENGQFQITETLWT